MKLSKTVFCHLEIEGIHYWAGCNIPEVKYLADPHRHLFHIEAYAEVNHNDRDIEFIKLKHQIEQYLLDKYYDGKTFNLCNFGGKSCESIAEELIEKFDLVKCVVSEDGENGSILEIIKQEESSAICPTTMLHISNRPQIPVSVLTFITKNLNENDLQKFVNRVSLGANPAEVLYETINNSNCIPK